MTFLFTLIFAILLHLCAALRATARAAYVWMAAHLAVALAGLLALQDDAVGFVLAQQPSGAIDPRLAGLVLFVPASLGLVCGRLALIERAGDKSWGHWRSGVFAWGLMVGLYHCLALADGIGFAAHRETVVADPGALGVNDVACAGPVVLRPLPNGVALYRCPHNAIWGGGTTLPFVPWPAYHEGHSLALGRAVERAGGDRPAGPRSPPVRSAHAALSGALAPLQQHYEQWRMRLRTGY